jgi:hypothetical protein
MMQFGIGILSIIHFPFKAIGVFGGTTLQILVGTDLWKHKFHEEDLANKRKCKWL